MSRTLPFIQRRGYTLNFRIAVPADLRELVGLREVTRSLGTADKHRAGPLALIYAAHVKHAFSLFRQAVQEVDEEKLKAQMVQAKHKLQLDALKDEHFAEVAGLHAQRRAELDRAKQVHAADIERARAEGAAKALLHVASTRPLQAIVPPAPATAATLPSSQTPDLRSVVNAFLKGFNKKKHPAMFKKHSGVLPLLLTVVGNKQVTDLRQADLNRLFEVVHRLPPRWVDQCRKRKISPLELAAEEHPVTMAPKSFEDTYKASIRAFLKAAKIDWQDQGLRSRSR